MLKIHFDGIETFDDDKQEFVNYPACDLELEHSLVSVSKWESIWEKPFLGDQTKSIEETTSYIACMQNDDLLPAEAFKYLSVDEFNKIQKYIEKKMTATWFSESNSKNGNSVVTSELIYFWMVTFQIDFQCQYWHLNRLMTLIRVCSEKNKPAKKMNKQEQMARMRELNNKRRMEMGTNG